MGNKNTNVNRTSRSFAVTSVALCAVLATARLSIPEKVYADANSYDWTKQGSIDPLGGNYTSVASSADGSHLIVSTTNGGSSDNVPSPLYTSSNYGATWQNISENADSGISDSWQSVAVSDNGQTMVAASNSEVNLSTSNSSGGNIFISHDAGNSWTNISPSGPNQWTNVAISGDGSKIVAVAYDDNDHVYISEDGGQSWVTSQTEQVGFWESLSISDDGSRVLAGGENYNNLSSVIDVSEDGGSSWQDVTPDLGNVAFYTRSTMSSNGQEIAVMTDGFNQSSSNYYETVYVSALLPNDGVNWSSVTPDSSESNQWSAIALSGNGSVLTALDDDNDTMYISNNDGTDWTKEDPDQSYGDANSNPWNWVAINENGSHIITSSPANIYTGYDTALENNSVTFTNAENAQAVELTTPSGTNVTCHSTTSASSLSAQDNGYNYPLGLVDFCFNEAEASNEVTLTFVTNLTPSEVLLRSYNSTTQQYTTITAASITETSYNGQPALQVTYNLPDSGLLDTDPNFGTVTDPVGLAVAPQNIAKIVKAPDTGFGAPSSKSSYGIIAPAATITLAAGIVLDRLRRKIKS